jgi:hypothetical protein
MRTFIAAGASLLCSVAFQLTLLLYPTYLRPYAWLVKWLWRVFNRLHDGSRYLVRGVLPLSETRHLQGVEVCDQYELRCHRPSIFCAGLSVVGSKHLSVPVVGRARRPLAIFAQWRSLPRYLPAALAQRIRVVVDHTPREAIDRLAGDRRRPGGDYDRSPD